MKPQATHHTDPDWQQRYQAWVATPEKAIERLRPGQRIFVGTGCAQPQQLIAALAARSRFLPDCEIVHLLTLGRAPYAHAALAPYFRVNSFFIADNVRELIQEGMGDYTPIFLSDIPALFRSGQLPLDVALIQVAPPDERGRCSLGISVDIVRAAAENASLVIAEVNARMPRTAGDPGLEVYDIDCLVPVDAPLPELPPIPPDEVTRNIANHVASLIEDGATLELGFGRVSLAVLECLKDKHDLGMHTELLTDSVVDLVEAGVLNGRRKTIDRGKVVASFCMGTRKLYDYIDANPDFCIRPTDYVNDPFTIGRQTNMVAVNVALEVDLTGQVCADSLGSKFFSGIGGQVDFNRGAARSPGGKAIIALPATAKGGQVSRIVAQLSPGAGVVTTRGDVHYVVTEFGVAYLHGKSVQERALALISIAHPDFCGELLRQAIELKYIRPELADVEGRFVVGPPDRRTTHGLDDGTQIHLRPIHPTDEPKVRDLFYSLSQQSIYYRFMSHMKRLPSRTVKDVVFVDHRRQVTIVATIPAASGDEVIAVGSYCLDTPTNRAEVAFVVRDDWQGRGLGRFLLQYLTTLARRQGIAGFTAEVLPDNRRMQAVFQKCAQNVTSGFADGVIRYRIDFA